ARIAVPRLIEQAFGAGLHGRHLVRIKNEIAAWTIRIHRRRLRVDAGKVRLAVRHAGTVLGAQACRCRKNEHCGENSGPSLGFHRAGSAADVKTCLPSANLTLRPDALLEPSLAREPSTLTTAPMTRASFVMPRRISAPGGAAENPHVVIFPFSSFTST